MVTGLALAALGGATSARAGLRLITETMTRGPVHAEFSYEKRTGSDGFGYQNASITIKRNGVTRVDGPVTIPNCSYCEVWPLTPRHSLRIRNLDRNEEKEVLLRLYTGGAHCCEYDRVYKFSPTTKSFLVRGHNFGDGFARIRDIDGNGVVEFKSVDNRFFYRFTAFAFSAAPIQIWHLMNGRFENVTQHGWRRAIRADKTRLWRAYRRERAGSYPEVRGILAAWMADKYLLRAEVVGWETMRRIEARGEFDFGASGPHGKRYLHHLRRFLGRTGYA